MIARSFARILGAAVVALGVLSAPIYSPSATADPCSDVAVVFARGTHQEPGLGNIGQAFVDSLTSQVGGRSVDVYAVNYPANDDYHTSASLGSDDASAHIQGTVANCPNTKIVLGGYSQGATVIDLASTAMPSTVADHVAAVALFGEPSSGFSSMLWGGQPLPTINSLYGAKTINLCAADDPICTGGGNIMAHVSYIQAGMTDQAASFAAGKLN
ncbi:cutinase family protein [Mycobacterium marinum]|uniref:cutinase family protein n=1 Tax=Mycobacterium marinum TaxID=1781 RepID=UPI000B97626F|nr:cutinase family protein [Mycobacterium marinum]MDC9016115.1 cutinase family protein [Mycobacterium marinum]